jgi:hypothetical protein
MIEDGELTWEQMMNCMIRWADAYTIEFPGANWIRIRWLERVTGEWQVWYHWVRD